MSWIEERKTIKKGGFKVDAFKQTSYPNKEFATLLKEEYPDLDLSLSQINKIIKTFINLSRREIEEKRDGFEITGFAHMIVLSRPVPEDMKIVDYKKSYERDREVRQLNLHTASRLCKIILSSKSRKYRIRNKRLWSFRFDSSFKGKVSKVFAKNFNRYLRVYKYSSIGKRLMDY